MKTKFSLLAMVAVIGIGSILVAPEAKAQPQQSEQVALQLGAILLGIDLNNPGLTNEQVAQALVQGRAVLNSTSSRVQVGINGQPINPATIQSSQLQAQILEATRLALTNPRTFNFQGVPVLLDNGRTVPVRANLNPSRTTASAIFAFATARVPNFSPGLVSDAINSAFATSSPGVYVFNYRNESALVADINRMATQAMRAGLSAYARGTRNWAPVPNTGVAPGATYLPNFSGRPIQPRSANPQAPDLAGLANAAGAISASAASALSSNLDDLSTLAIRVSAVTQLAQSLVRGANRVQRVSTGGAGSLTGGAVAGSGFGQVAILTDTSVDLWSDQASVTVLNSIIAGGVRGAGGANSYAFAWGVATGYVAAFLEANGTSDFDAFRNANVPLLQDQFLANRVRPSNRFDTGVGPAVITLDALLTEAFNKTYQAFLDQDYSNIAGAVGLNLPGVPTPVTDTVGL